MHPGQRVETAKPETETEEVWTEADQKLRQWGVIGHIKRVEEFVFHGKTADWSDTHYEVEHDDKTSAWYERRELVVCDGNSYTPAERTAMLKKMSAVADSYYKAAAASGCHALIEFTGLMNEFIMVCEIAHRRGEQFPFANTHSGYTLPFVPGNFQYLAEKLDCIYGPALVDEDNRAAFVGVMFPGFELVPTKRP